jgi:hypothetical protein
MISCADVEPLIARYAEDDAAGTRVPADVTAHIDGCPSCRRALEEQREVRRLLLARPPAVVSSSFTARLSDRLGEQHDWLGLVNWRAWTVGLAPVAGALVLVAFLGWGSKTESPSTTTRTPAAAVALEWPTASARTPASVLMQPGASGEQLLEAVLTGAVPASVGDPAHVR